MDRRVRWAILGFLVALFCVSGPWLALYSMGYRFRLGDESGRTTIVVEERGLILLESTPSGASVSVDGTLTKLKTPASIYRPAPSECTVTLSLLGHQEWTRAFKVQPQTVSRAENIVLPPSKIEPQLVTAMPVSCFALSGDGKFLAFADTANPPHLWLKDTSSAEDAVKIPHDSPRFFSPKTVVQQIEFAAGSRAALITARVGDATANQTFWLSLREPYELVKLDELVSGGETFKINPRTPHQVFVVAGGQLNRVDAKERTVKRDISRDIEAVELGDDSLWLVRQGSSVIHARPFNSDEPADDKELLTFATPVPDGALEPTRRIVADGSRNAALLLANEGALVRDDTRKLAPAFQGVQMIAFSPDHRWVALADANSVQIIDAFPIRGALFERSTEPQREMLQPYRVENGTSISQIFWWDDAAHLLVRRGKMLDLIETDLPLGGHRIVLLDNLPEDSPLSFDPKEAAVYFTKRAESGAGELLLYSARLRAPAKGMLDWLIKPKPPTPSATLSAP